MNEELKKSRIGRFMSDETTSQLVYQELQKAFLKGKGPRDIQILAAERLSLDFLDVVWKDLEKFKTKDDSEVGTIKQVGL